jgi:hypothetical protein
MLTIENSAGAKPNASPRAGSSRSAVVLVWMAAALSGTTGTAQALGHAPSGRPVVNSASPCKADVLGLVASGAATSLIPPCHGAVGYLWAASATLGIGLIADLVQLLQCPRRLSDQPKEEPPVSLASVMGPPCCHDLGTTRAAC